MTEEEWLTTTDITGMQRVLSGTDPCVPLTYRNYQRKVMLFAVACSRSELVQDTRLCNAIALIERFADGLAIADELQKAMEDAGGMPPGPQKELALALLDLKSNNRLGAVPGMAARLEIAHLPGDPLRKTNLPAHQKIWRIQTNLLREIFGNPFRIVAFESKYRSVNVMSLAKVIYAERRFAELPILADALEDAGFDNSEMLHHFRQKTEHRRGCWALDLVLGKEECSLVGGGLSKSSSD